ncbi:MAG TPA: right-handed parallel beta-helix repeat-containing protein [Candidatus Baltobacteraceae bacterium]|nr:right-handed parallel beta-helix repeat-containing protein [Candidatus Baltobacteraceae bacterium]
MPVASSRPSRFRLPALSWGVALAIAVVPVVTAGLPGPAAASATAGACDTTLQGLIDHAAAGSALVVPPCVYRESVTVDKPLTIDGTGATIDGRDASGAVVRDTWMTIAASDVTVRGFTMRYASNKPQTGALRVEPGVSRVTIAACDLGFAAGADVSIGVADQSTITGCSIHDAGQLGVHLGGDGTNGVGNAVIDDRIFHNNTAGYDPGFEAGGLKATLQKGLVIEGNEVYDNAGPGIWCDIECQDVTISGDRVHDNDDAGIFYEVSQGGVIQDNDVWSNGWQQPAWGWGAGILLSSSGTTTVSDNVVAWNATGIAVISQDRKDWPHSATGVSVSDNVIAGSAGRYLLAWLQDWQGELFKPASANQGTANRFWVDGPAGTEGRFAWDSDIGSLAAFAATPGGRASEYVATGAMPGLLAVAGVPLGPSSLDVPPPLPVQAVRTAEAHPLVVAAVGAVGLLGGVAVVLALAWSRRRRSRGTAGGR